jgi:uncharacterized membrane protein
LKSPCRRTPGGAKTAPSVSSCRETLLTAPTGYSKHRVEALADAIFAVAMTLLVIELQLPEHSDVLAQRDLVHSLVLLIPKFVAWIISFVVLAIFWFAHHRLFHYVRAVDGSFLWLNILYLGGVSLMPFSSAVAGEYSRMLVSQVIYSANMTAVAVGALLLTRYVFRHQELWSVPMARGFYRASIFRIAGLIAIAVGAIGIAMVVPGAGNAAFMLMLPISVLSARIERRG